MGHYQAHLDIMAHGLSCQLFYQRERKCDRRACATRSDNVSIDNNGVLAIAHACNGDLIAEFRIAGRFSPRQVAIRRKYRRCGADRTRSTVGLGIALQQFLNPRIFAQVFHARHSTGEHQHIEVLLHHVVQCRIRNHHGVARTLDRAGK